MTPPPEPLQIWDVFLSHGGPDKPWVQTLADELAALGLQPFLDVREIEPADSFPGVLSRGLVGSRFLVLILSPRSSRPWVDLEWQSFIAHHGPLGRVLPVLLESTEIPALLASIQRIDATDRDAARVAREIAHIAGRPGQLKEGDFRRLVLGQDLVFNLSREGEELRLIDPLGRTRTVTPPWRVDNRFGLALHFFDRLSREPVTTDADRTDLVSRATTLGNFLFDLLFDEEGHERLRQARVPGRPRPLITICSDDDFLLSLPWELLWEDGSFLLRDARVDLARSTPDEVGPDALLREPDGPLKLVVNVSAPEGSGLDYEGESYRITKALSDQCRFVPTELGTVEDLVETVRVEHPTAIHFSGHGAPGSLAFEDEEGRTDEVPIQDLLQRLRARIDGELPPLFYLASCHGNTAGVAKTDEPKEGKLRAESSSAHLHREGVPQVVGYYGPIVDKLSTRAEVAFYRALAEGETTRYAVRQAREALPAPSFPFAWAQLVFYHRGPDHPLSLAAATGMRPHEPVLQRTFEGVGDRRILTTGFIGRRSELHCVRRWIKEGRRVFVFQGLGGLGKSTLAFHAIPMLLRGEGVAVTLWCQEVEQRPDRAQGLTGQLLDFCRKTFGVEWEPVAFQVDRTAGDDSVQRFSLFLQVLLQNLPRLVLYLDNLESLLVGPKDSQAENDESALGQWASEDLGRLWRILTELARDNDRLYLIASCRYRNPDFAGALLPVSPMPPDALYRLMGWFPALRRLSGPSRVRLVSRIAGHPRAVEYANDLLAHALAEREDRGVPRLPENPTEADLEREWAELVEPVLPRVQDKLWANLLLAEIWDRVLDDRARRMLYRMTLLRRPWDWKLAAVLGEEEEGEEAAFATGERLLRSSLLETAELLVPTAEGGIGTGRRYTLHPATAQFVRSRFGDDEPLRRATHQRLGDHLEAEARNLPLIDQTYLETGHHLFQAGEYDKAYNLLGPASDLLQDYGRVREGLQVLEPFLNEQVRNAMSPQPVGRLLGTIGLAYKRLGEFEKAITYQEQALVIFFAIGDRRREGAAFGNLGVVHAAMGDLDKAMEEHERHLAIAREIGDRLGESQALMNLGLAYESIRQWSNAIGYYEQALVISREIEYHQGEGRVLANLGAIYLTLGALEKSIRFAEQALVIAHKIGDRAIEGGVLGNLGIAYRTEGELEKAIGYFERSLTVHREIGDRRGEGGDLANIGSVYGQVRETSKAIALLKQALEIGRAVKDPEIVQITTAELARLHGT